MKIYGGKRVGSVCVGRDRVILDNVVREGFTEKVAFG